MDEDYYQHYKNENYASIGRTPARPWEILPIWLYLVSVTMTRAQHFLSEKKRLLTTPPKQTALISAYDALQAFVPSLSKRVLFTRYPSCIWQECSSLAARQFGVVNLLLTVVRVHAGLSIHAYGAYNAGIVAAAIMLVHYVGERMNGSIRGSALSAAEVATFVTFVWMMVQREKYVGECICPVLCCVVLSHWRGMLGSDF